MSKHENCHHHECNHEDCDCCQCVKEKQVVLAKEGAKPAGPYSPGMRVGNLLFVSGQLGIDPQTGDLVAGGIEPETRQVISNLRAVLEGAGIGLDQVVKTTVFLSDIREFGVFNSIYGEFFRENPPARSTFQVAAMPRGASVQIEAVALIPCNCDCCE